VLTALREETGAEAIFAEADVSPFARARDLRVGNNFPLNLVPGLTVQPPQVLRKADGKPYTVFTPFSRMWRSLPFPGNPLEAPEHLPTLPPLDSLPIPLSPAHEAESPFPAGEAEAVRRLSVFTENSIWRYTDDRNCMALEGTSGLSPYLRFGMLSARQAASAAMQAESWARDPLARQGAETWLNELIWREFYAAILYHFPQVRCIAFRPELRRIPWRNDPAEFAAWREGRTGCPVVDARGAAAGDRLQNRLGLFPADCGPPAGPGLGPCRLPAGRA